jgi:uncharacterized protein (DUF4415 family)
MARDKSLEPEFGTPDEENPEWTEEDFAKARPLNELLVELGYKPLGRPRAEITKTPVNLRLDPEIVTHFKAGGDGWQTRINAVLSKHVKAANAAATRKKRA